MASFSWVGFERGGVGKPGDSPWGLLAGCVLAYVSGHAILHGNPSFNSLLALLVAVVGFILMVKVVPRQRSGFWGNFAFATLNADFMGIILLGALHPTRIEDSSSLSLLEQGVYISLWCCIMLVMLSIVMLVHEERKKEKMAAKIK